MPSIKLNGVNSDALITGYTVNTAKFTACFWYKPTKVDANDRVVDSQDSGPQNGWVILHATANSPQVQFVTRNVGTSVVTITSVDMVMDQWNFIAVVASPTENKLFVNGNQQGVTDIAGTMTASTNAVCIGKRAGASTNYAQGLFAGFQSYARILSRSELYRIYKRKAPLMGCEVCIPFDDGSGSTAIPDKGIRSAALTNVEWSSDTPYASRDSLIGPRRTQAQQPVTYLEFDGVDDYIDLNATNVLPDATPACSIFAWIYREGTSVRGIIGNQRDSTTVGWNFKISSAAINKLEFTFYNAAGSSRGWIGNAQIPQGRWCHVGVTFDGVTCRFYIDGIEEEKETLTTAATIAINSADDITIGWRIAGGAGNEFFNGKIGQVLVYNRVLNRSEIENLYQLGTVPQNSLRGWWKLDEGVGSVATDSSSLANNGAITGPAWGS